MKNIGVITTFGNQHFEPYAKQMVQSFAQYWPKEIPLLIQLDDALLAPDLDKIIRPQDAIFIGRTKEHQEFIERNKGKDDPSDYRKQPVRFCHKVFAIKNALEAVKKTKEAGAEAPRYLIWLDADVHTTAPVSMEELKACLPKEGDAVAYLGRKDWPHSECGWLAFDLENGAIDLIDHMYSMYVLRSTHEINHLKKLGALVDSTEPVFLLDEWHDSWVFDEICRTNKAYKRTNLTADKPGMDIWQHSPMAKWSVHHKGPVAKNVLSGNKQIAQPLPKGRGNVVIQTKNAIPHEKIREQIAENQRLIKNWLTECLPTDEKIVVVSAGPSLIAEELRKEVALGRKVIAVKHALIPLKKANIKPWACILLDPRPHVADFVKEPDTDILWFVASQVNPEVTKRLLAAGCEVWGYHASVGAGEHELTNKQPFSIVNGGSATATRGLFVLSLLGFRKFLLYGYELSFPDKPDLNAKDELGQPKYLEFSVGLNDPMFTLKRQFYTEPQLIAQFEEFDHLLQSGKFEIEAYGDGLVPFIVRAYKTANLRRNELKGKMAKRVSYRKLLKWKTSRKTTTSLTWLRKALHLTRLRMS